MYKALSSMPLKSAGGLLKTHKRLKRVGWHKKTERKKVEKRNCKGWWLNSGKRKYFDVFIHIPFSLSFFIFLVYFPGKSKLYYWTPSSIFIIIYALGGVTFYYLRTQRMFWGKKIFINNFRKRNEKRKRKQILRH